MLDTDLVDTNRLTRDADSGQCFLGTLQQPYRRSALTIRSIRDVWKRDIFIKTLNWMSEEGLILDCNISMKLDLVILESTRVLPIICVIKTCVDS
jgi:hypothetical protein